MDDTPPPIAAIISGPSHKKNLSLLFPSTLHLLDGKNYNEWHAALTDICIIAEAAWALCDPLLPPDGLGDRYQLKLLSEVRRLIRKSISPEIRGELSLQSLTGNTP